MATMLHDYKIANIDSNFIYVQGFPEHTAESLGATYTSVGWRIPLNRHALRELYRLYPNKDVLRLGKKLKMKRDQLLNQKAMKDNPILTAAYPELKRLRPYQRVDVGFLSQLKHAGIFNQQRTGKTPTLLSLIRVKGFKRVGIVVPASLILNWAEEVRTWLGWEPILIKGPASKRKQWIHELTRSERYCFIVSYESLRQDIELYSKIQLNALAVDEAHRLRNRKTKQTLAVKTLGRQAQYRYALTGTPSVRGAEDIWSILNFLYPEKFPGYWQFIDRYFHMVENWMTGMRESDGTFKRKEELQEILALLATNRKREEVMDWLPKKNRQTIHLEMSKAQKKPYEDVEMTFQHIEDGELKVDCEGVLAQMTRLRQICTCPESLGIQRARNVKEEFLLDWLEDNKEPVLVFSTFTGYLHQLYEKLNKKYRGRVGIITGKVKQIERKIMMERFQDGELDILLCNIKAAGVGLTLDRAETTIFLDKEWNPSDNFQAEDRMVPTTQERNHSMQVLSLVIRDTWDEIIDDLLESKYNITEIINSGGIEALKRLHEELKKGG